MVWTHLVTRLQKAVVDRRYWNDDNGRFNLNADRNPDNRKLSKQCLFNLTPNVGRLSANSSRPSGIHVHRLSSMSYKTLFQKTFDLVKWVYPTVNKFPKKQRLVLSQRIEITSIRILEMVIDFCERDTRVNRKKILHEIHKLQILLRLCKDLSVLSFRQYEFASSLLLEISDILRTEDTGLIASDQLGGGIQDGLQRFIW